MKAHIKTTTTTTVMLELSTDEMKRLRNMMQNPIHEHEDPEDANLRSDLWHTLTKGIDAQCPSAKTSNEPSN